MKPSALLFFLSCLSFACSAPGTGTEAPPLFVLRDPDHTGVYFSNTLEESEQLNILTFEYFYNGAGVGIGDVDNDGRPDLFFSGNMTGSRLYLNRGGLRFEDATERAGIDTRGRWATGVSLVDINGDGWLDIYVACAGPYGPARRANLFYLNKGDGTFREQAAALGLADTGHTTQAAFFDYDRDGDLDVYLLTNITDTLGPNIIRPKRADGRSPNTDRLYRNDDGRFADVSRAAGILHEGYGLGVAVSDIDQDGWPDLYVSNDYLSNDLLYLNQQDGTFQERAAECFRHTSYSAMGTDVADCNNDGRPDIVTVDMLPPDHRRRKLLTSSINYDRFRSEMLAGYTPQYMRNTLQLHQGAAPSGAPVFSEIGQLAGIQATDWSWSPLFADLDNDGWKDLLVTNGYPRDITNRDFASYKMHIILQAHYDRNSQSSLLKALQSLEVAHLPNYAFHNRGDLTFEDVSANWGFTHPSYSHGAALGDLDGDGDLDYVVNNTNGLAFIYENRGAAGHHFRLRLAGPAGNPTGFGAKVWLHAGGQVQFQECSPYRGFQSSVEPVLHFGLGEALLIDYLRVQWPDGAVQRWSALDADRTLTADYREALPEPAAPPPVTIPLFTDLSDRRGLSYRHVEEHYADFKVQPLLPHKHSQQGPAIDVGDLDGDGLEDFFIGGAFRRAGHLFFQRPDASFYSRPLADGPNYEEDLGCLLFDADSDGDLDLYVTSGGSEFEAGSHWYQDRLYRNDGKGNFQLDPAALPAIRSSTACVSSADYDSDGDLDLFVGGRIDPANYAVLPESFLLENRGGRFVDVTNQWAPDLRFAGRISAAQWTDLDGDRRPDLLLAGEWMPLTCFYNSGEGFRRQPIPESTGWWNSLAAADLDGDGDTDFVAGNLGLNNPYRPEPGRPLRLHVNDFDQDGRAEALITSFLQGTEAPVHYRDDLLTWLYALRKELPDYQTYAEASWEALFPPDVRAGSEVTTVDQSASVWVEATPGGFVLHPLPVEAQFAPVHGIAIDDYDADGYPDLLLAGNSSATESNTGRYDGLNGLLLRGDGRGSFQPAPFTESGFYLPGDGKALASLRLADGRTLILAARNNAKLKAFAVGRRKLIE